MKEATSAQMAQVGFDLVQCPDGHLSGRLKIPTRRNPSKEILSCPTCRKVWYSGQAAPPISTSGLEAAQPQSQEERNRQLEKLFEDGRVTTLRELFEQNGREHGR